MNKFKMFLTKVAKRNEKINWNNVAKGCGLSFLGIALVVFIALMLVVYPLPYHTLPLN